MTAISERCICGATETVEYENIEKCLELIKDWRKEHKHVEPESSYPHRYEAKFGDSEGTP